MNEPRQRLTNRALHGREEWIKRIFRDQIAEAAGILEVVLSGIVLIALLMSIVPLLRLMPGLLTDADSMEVHTFLERALDIVIGIEFIKMLAKHSPGSVLRHPAQGVEGHLQPAGIRRKFSHGGCDRRCHRADLHHPQIFLCAVLRP